VVDNNSTDNTREVVEAYRAQGRQNLSYSFEPRQGVSYARNTGIGLARAPIIAFADDDVRVARDWVANIKRAFDRHPEIDCIGGKVLPRWQTPPPAWLTRAHWMPLALLDYGDEPFLVGANKRLCLVSANLALRRELLAETGLFALDLQRVKDSIGSMEDTELLERIWQTGRQCLYAPDLMVTTEVPAERMTKRYHRRWHAGHGHFFAIMRAAEMERSASRWFDVPAHLYKQAIADAAAWLKYFLLGKGERAFTHETRVRFFAGFFRKRRRDFLGADGHSTLREIARLIRALASKKTYRELAKRPAED
jgi:glycosyltransferase involved in cell wall biosynthesis